MPRIALTVCTTAGRGVGYDRIYPVLLDYAKNDANPQVRQWAVEGMRYLGTDEAIDQLFDSFVHDPSDAVRDRAGCNVSDCGNFKRKQRMRMVSKLIELAADPQTTPQMRNSAFLALREITDETLPADASAWQDWYTQHVEEKMAEFEQLDWWSIREQNRMKRMRIRWRRYRASSACSPSRAWSTAQ
ncbi:MAG TPA: HEAT repeat domain-containing protein [Terriglobales bacterium]|nr:HEAT repeat domain-containing protein [Terriglobales bacterium]